MSSFEYTAPAEVFLAKPAELCRNKYRHVSLQRRKRSVSHGRTYAHREPSAHGWRWGTSASQHRNPCLYKAAD
jgi:hypothetical protein